jgi:hypothetical protein
MDYPHVPKKKPKCMYAYVSACIYKYKIHTHR